MRKKSYFRISIKGIVIDEQQRILLSREDNGKWEMLGGGLDHEEDPHACLRREIHEETGLEVSFISKQPKYFVTSPRSVDGEIVSYIANVIYEIKLQNLDFTPSDECQELRYFNLKEMEEVDLFPNVEKLRLYLQENGF